MSKEIEKNKIPEKESSSPIPSRLGPSFSLKGELWGNADLIIQGQFNGSINLGQHDLVVERGGKVKADIQGKNITIDGEVEGNIHASGKVFISQKGKMMGDIQAPKVSIMDGAQFKGSVKMKEATSSPGIGIDKGS